MKHILSILFLLLSFGAFAQPAGQKFVIKVKSGGGSSFDTAYARNDSVFYKINNVEKFAYVQTGGGADSLRKSGGNVEMLKAGLWTTQFGISEFDTAYVASGGEDADTLFYEINGIKKFGGLFHKEAIYAAGRLYVDTAGGIKTLRWDSTGLVHWSKLGNNDIISTNTTGVVRADTAFYLSSSNQTGIASTSGATLQLRSSGLDILKVQTPAVSSPALLETGLALTGSPSYTYKSVFGVPNTFGSSATNSMNFYGFNMNPTIDQSTHGTGAIVGFRYAPTVTSLNGSPHYAWLNTAGDIRFGHLSGGGNRLLSVDNYGDVNTIAYDTSAFKIENDTLKPRKKEYIAYLYQDGTNAPDTLYVIKNTLGENPSYAYNSDGSFELTTSSPLFTKFKTTIEFLSGDVGLKNSEQVFAVWITEHIVGIFSSIGDALTNGVIGNISIGGTSVPTIIKITVYP